MVEGRVDLTKNVNGVERVIGPRGPGELYGEVPVMLSMTMPASCVAVEPSRVLKVDVGTFFTLAAMAPQVVATVGALAQGRMEGLKELAPRSPRPTWSSSVRWSIRACTTSGPSCIATASRSTR